MSKIKSLNRKRGRRLRSTGIVKRRRIDCGYYVEATYTPPKFRCWSITVPTLAEGLKLLRECKCSREGQNGQIKFRLVENVRNRVA